MGSFPGRVIPKTLKMGHAAFSLGVQHKGSGQGNTCEACCAVIVAARPRYIKVSFVKRFEYACVKKALYKNEVLSCHITPILKDLHWLPVSYRIIYKILLIVYKSLIGCAPNYISDLLKSYIPTRALRSSDKLLLCEQKTNHSWGDRSFGIAAPRLWNQLPLHVRSSNSLATFKTNLKTHLMSKAFI